MGIVMTNSFAELSVNELEAIDGDKWYHVVGAVIGGVGGAATGATIADFCAQ